MIEEDFPKNLIAFEKKFHSELACLNYIRKQRWGSETAFTCPRCQHRKCWEGRTRKLLYCASCGKQVSITLGTIFHGSRKPLQLWFRAMYMTTTSKRGLSAKELQRAIDICYPIAWSWLQKIRECMVDPNREPLKGEIEVDETYIGGTAQASAKGRSTIKKTAVICAVEKNGRACGRVRLGIIQNATREKLQAFLKGTLEQETTVHTDGWRGYDGLERSGYAHIRTVSKPKEAHLNLPRVHCVFSLVKRWLMGTHQGAVSRKHLQAYLEEYTFRFNRRNAGNRGHLFQRLVEGSIRTQCRYYWQIVGRTKSGVPMRTNASLRDILGNPHKKLTWEEIMAEEARMGYT